MLTQSFAHSHVRLRPTQTDGATASAAALGEGKADLAIIRGDLEVPKNAQAVATLRKNVTSPGGTTAAALKVLMRESGGLKELMAEAVLAAEKRSRELGT